MQTGMQQIGTNDLVGLVDGQQLHELGVRGGLVAEYWREKQGCDVLRVGLDNCDTDHVLLSLLEDDPEAVAAGSVLAAQALQSGSIRLYLPQGKGSLAQRIQPYFTGQKIEITEGIVDVDPSTKAAFHHIETVYALARIADGKWDKGRHLSVVQDGRHGPLQKVAFGSPLSPLLPREMKALRVGAHLYGPEGAELVVAEDLPIAGGVVEVYTDSDCMVDRTVRWIEAMRQASCGKCAFCREGYGQLHAVAKDFTKGKGEKGLVPFLSEIASAMQYNTLCSVGQAGGAYCQDSFTGFTTEYEAHLKKNCPAGVCLSSEVVYIDPHACSGCGDCLDICPADAIEGRPRFIHMIDKGVCTLCGACIDLCPENAIVRTAGKAPKLPTRPTKCGRFR